MRGSRDRFIFRCPVSSLCAGIELKNLQMELYARRRAT